MADVHEDEGGEEGGGCSIGDGTLPVFSVGSGENVEGEGLHAGSGLVFGEALDGLLVLRGRGEGERGERRGGDEGRAWPGWEGSVRCGVCVGCCV